MAEALTEPGLRSGQRPASTISTSIGTSRYPRATRPATDREKSRLTRGREALRQRLLAYVREVGTQLGLQSPMEHEAKIEMGSRVCSDGREVEVMP